MGKRLTPKSDDALDIETLTDMYSAPLRRYFLRHVRQREDAEDMVQEVFSRLIRNQSAEQIENPQAYLFRIASNLLRDKRRRDRVRHSDAHEPYDELYHPYEDISPERVLIGKQELERLKKSILKLPPRVKAAFILHRFEGLTYKEIAEALGISVSAVEKNMMTAIARLSKEFGRK